jgi:hypothetical protein
MRFINDLWEPVEFDGSEHFGDIEDEFDGGAVLAVLLITSPMWGAIVYGIILKLL